MDWTQLDNHNHRSSPIEIPQRRRRLSTFSVHPIEHSQSSDMIFEMSPITSNLSSHSNYLPQSSPRNFYDQEPFLYHFPVFSAHNFKKSSCIRDAPARCQEIPISHVFTPAKNSHKRQRRVTEYHANESAHKAPPIIRKSAATKIVGFSPAIPTNCAHCNSKKAPPPQERMSPRPQSPAFSWSPYILPSKQDPRDETSSFEQDSERFHLNNLQLVPSARF